MVNYLEREIKNEIMATTVSIVLCDENISVSEMEFDIEHGFNSFREFEAKFSRFKTNNELTDFNKSEGVISVSPDMYTMLNTAYNYNKSTLGVFDITMLPILLSEGYVVSKEKGFYANSLSINSIPYVISGSSYKLLDAEHRTVNKPVGLQVDLGGIGKGYIVEKVSKQLEHKYQNFIVDAGGDMYVKGKDLAHNYDYWAIAIENPISSDGEISTLMISNKGVATSGVNKRNWLKNSVRKNHIIDVSSRKSVSNDLLTVTVVSDSIVDADIMAKSLLLMGLSKGLAFSAANGIASFFVDKQLNLYKSVKMENYVWKA